jgi:hypothetical protein
MPNRSQEGTFMILKHAEVTAHESTRRTKDDSLDHELPEECRAVRSVLALVGNKWSMMIIVILGNSPLAVSRRGCLLLRCADWSATAL